MKSKRILKDYKKNFNTLYSFEKFTIQADVRKLVLTTVSKIFSRRSNIPKSSSRSVPKKTHE